MQTCPNRLKLTLPSLLALTAFSLPAFGQAPANDNFADAAGVAFGTTANGTLTNATAEAGEPPTHLQTTANVTTGAATGRSVWYTWTSGIDGMAYFEMTPLVTGAAAGAAMQGAVWSGTTLGSLTRRASAYSPAGAAGPPVANGTKATSNLFPVTAGTTYYLQLTGNNETGGGDFSYQVNFLPARGGSVVLPFGSNWEWLHPTTAGANPATNANWATTWQTLGDQTDYGAAPGVQVFSLTGTAPFGWGGINLGPGQRTVIGASSVAANNTANNAAYFRTSFTLTNPTSSLWAEIMADDGAWIFINGQPVSPVNIRAKVTSSGAATPVYSFTDYRSLASAHITNGAPVVAPATHTGCLANDATLTEDSTKLVFLGGLGSGTHTIAVSLHQNSLTSSDQGFDLQLLDMAPRRLLDTALKINFEEAPYTAAAAAAGYTTQQFAPKPGQTDAAWRVTAPATRGTTALRAPYPVASTATGTQLKALRLNAAECGPFITEPVNVTGLTDFVASIKVLASDTSSGFETGDGFRVFLETSTDGQTFSDPGDLNVQPQVNGADALTPFSTGWTTLSLPVTGNTANYVRLVITGGTDSTSENIYFDDVSISRCQVLPSVSNIVYNNMGDDDQTNDTVSFDLTVAGTNTTGPGWVTNGLGAGNEVSNLSFGAAGTTTITRPATNASGVRTNIAFAVEDAGDSSCRAPVTVTIPACAIGTTTVENIVRNPGVLAEDPDDDTFTVTLNTAAANAGMTYEVRSNDTNSTVYGSGAYGASVVISDVPVFTTVGTTKTYTASLMIQDKADPACRRAVTLSGYLPVAMGRTNLGGPLLYGTPPLATGSNWRQMAADVANSGVTRDTETLIFSPGAAPLAGTTALETPPVTVTGQTGVIVRARLRAWEDSTGTGFEATDTFRLEVIHTAGAVETTVNLIEGNPADADGNFDLNGYTGTNAADYDANLAKDEFNAEAAAAAGASAGWFNFSFPVPAGTDTVRVRLTGVNNSGNEFYFVQGLFIGTGAADTDSDGLPDDWEVQYFGSTSAQGATGDPDGDGQSNAAELAAGTVPNNGTSALRITAISATPTAVSLTFPSVAGKSYRAQWAQGLSGWADIGAVTAASGAETTIMGLPVPAAGEPRWFYRVRLVE
jgi:hypothetical protein